jgi:hypothetical protein
MDNKPQELSKHALEQSCVSPLCCRSHLIQMRSSWWILVNIGQNTHVYTLKKQRINLGAKTLLNLMNTCGRAWNQHAHQVRNIQPNKCKLPFATISLASLLVPRKFLRTSWIMAQIEFTKKPEKFSWSNKCHDCWYSDMPSTSTQTNLQERFRR